MPSASEHYSCLFFFRNRDVRPYLHQINGLRFPESSTSLRKSPDDVRNIVFQHPQIVICSTQVKGLHVLETNRFA